jgi:peroxiredoxin
VGRAGTGILGSVRGLIFLVAALVACTPAPVLNPNKQQAKRAGREVQATLTLAPEAMVKKRDGTPFDLAQLWDKEKDQKVVVVFYRGGWCPHCQKQMAELQSRYKDFDAAKAIVVGVSNETGDAATAFRSKLGLGFELYSDPELTMITKWGVEDYGSGIARPATFVIEPGGAITYSKIGQSPSDHPTSDELLAALR